MKASGENLSMKVSQTPPLQELSQRPIRHHLFEGMAQLSDIPGLHEQRIVTVPNIFRNAVDLGCNHRYARLQCLDQ